MKKKLVVFTFVLTMAGSIFLTACGSESEDAQANVEMETEETEEEKAKAGEETGKEDKAEEEAKAEEENAAKEEKKTEAEEETADEYIKGIITENGWESEWIGIRYTTPEGMNMSSEEELDEVMGLGKEVLADDYTERQLAYAEMVSVYEMMSVDEAGATNVFVTVEKLPKTLTTEEFVDLMINNLECVTAIQYEISSRDEMVTIGAREFNKVACKADYQGVAMCQDYYTTVIGDRAVTIAITYIDMTDDLAQEVFDAFGAY